MPLGTMAALMLTIGLLSGLLPDLPKQFRTRKFYLLAFLILTPVLRMASIGIAAECELNAACLFTLALLCAAAAVLDGKRMLLIVPLSLILAIPAFFLNRALESDAAVLACALLVLLLLPLVKKPAMLCFAAALVPVFAAAFELLAGLAFSGYGVFELSGQSWDVQLVGAMLITYFFELRRFSGARLPNARSDEV